MEKMQMTDNSNNSFLKYHLPNVKVMGLGGAGCNTINHIMELNLPGIECIAANTDMQVLNQSRAPIKIQLGPVLTRGLGSGGDPEIGEKSAEESFSELNSALEGADLVFLTAGMGGGTGTGAIPVAARLAHSLNAVVICIVSTPFQFENGKRQNNAREGIAQLRPYADTLIVVPNDRLLQIAPVDSPLEMAFRLSDDILRQSIQSISELISQTGIINVDFAHILRIMRIGGGSYIAIGYGQGEGKAQQALQSALNHPLLDHIALDQAKGMIVNFSGGASLTMSEVVQALNKMRTSCHPDIEIIPGLTYDAALQDRAQAILIVTGIGATEFKDPLEAAAINSTSKVGKDPEINSESADSLEHAPSLFAAGDDIEIPAFMRKQNHLVNVK